MLSVYFSHRTELLAEQLCSTLIDADASPMHSFPVIIQNRGMQVWLQRTITELNGMCAGIEFFFASEFFELLYACCQDEPDQLLKTEQIFWYLFTLLHSDEHPHLPEHIAQLLKDDTTSMLRYDLATTLAALFDAYQAYRPSMVHQWVDKIESDPKHWQAILMHTLSKQGTLRLQGMQQVISDIATVLPRLFSRTSTPISFFGVNSLGPMYMEFFEHLATLMPINFFILSPSSQFWLDLKPLRHHSATAARRNMSLEAYAAAFSHHIDTSILSTQARALQQFLGILPDEIQIHDDFSNHPPLCLLHRVQQRLVSSEQEPASSTPQKKSTRQTRSDTQDYSVQIHRCTSAFREVEVLHDRLLYFLSTSDITADEVVVMTPDIALYAPLIQAVFGSREHQIPFSIVDQAAAIPFDATTSYLQLLSLLQSRITCQQLYDFFDSAAGTFLGVNSSFFETLSEQYGVSWGIDKEHIASIMVEPRSTGTLLASLETIANHLCGTGPGVEELYEIYFDEEQFFSQAGNFVAFVRRLQQWYTFVATSHTIEQWKQFLSELLLSCLAAETKGFQQTAQAIQNIAASCPLQDTECSFTVLSELVEKKLEQQGSLQRYFSGGVSICSFLPLRAVPFKAVCLLGLNDGSFPRPIARPELDVLHQDPRPADRNSKDEDRLLFLEALLCAREYLYISYSAADSSQQPALFGCSSVVQEIYDWIEQFENTPPIVQHPLHPFHGNSFSTDPLRGTFSSLYVPQQYAPNKSADSTEIATISQRRSYWHLDELIYCFKKPLHWFAKNNDIAIPRTQAPLRVSEPLVLEDLSRYTVRHTCLHLLNKGASNTEIHDYMQHNALLPEYTSGSLAIDKIINQLRPSLDTFALQQTTRSLHSVDISPYRLRAHLSIDQSNQQICLWPALLHEGRKIESHLRHLCANAIGPTTTSLWYLKKNDDEALSSQTLPPLEQTHEVRQQLCRIIDLAHKLSCVPAALLAELSISYIRAKRKGSNASSIQRAIETAWHKRTTSPEMTLFCKECPDFIHSPLAEMAEIFWNMAPEGLINAK